MSPDAFAAEWIAAWNAHDLDRILAHYAEGIVFVKRVLELVEVAVVAHRQAVRDMDVEHDVVVHRSCIVV